MSEIFDRRQFILDFVAERDRKPCRLHWHRGHTNGQCHTQNPGLRPKYWRMKVLDEIWLEDNPGAEALYEIQQEREKYQERERYREEGREQKGEEDRQQRRERKSDSDDGTDGTDEDYSGDSDESEDFEDDWAEHWYDYEVRYAVDHAEEQHKGLVYAKEQVAIIQAREELLMSDIAANKPTPLGPLIGEWKLYSTQYHGGEMARQSLSFLRETWNQSHSHDQEPCCSLGHCPPESNRFCGQFFCGPGGSEPMEVLQFEPPTQASLDKITVHLTGYCNTDRLYVMRVVFLGDGRLRATVPRCCVEEYQGPAEMIELVGTWFDTEKSKREYSEKKRKREEEESRYESSPKATDWLKPWKHW